MNELAEYIEDDLLKMGIHSINVKAIISSFEAKTGKKVIVQKKSQSSKLDRIKEYAENNAILNGNAILEIIKE
jgi:hypothetical protein